METQINPQEIMERLVKLQEDVNFIREQMEYLEDTTLTNEERKLLDESLIHEREGKLVSLEEIKNARNRNRKTT